MHLALLLSLQVAAAPAPPPATAPRIGAGDFDLAKVKASAPPGDVHSLFHCDRSGDSAIVVCARRAGPAYPLDEMARIFEAKPLRAETGIGNGATANVHVEQGVPPQLPPGVKTNRIMVGIKLPF